MKTKVSSLQVGDTPLIKLLHLFSDEHFGFYAKMEGMNPGGSIKDRTSARIIENAIQKGLINQDTTIIESTSGNMGVGLSRICRLLNLRLILVVDPYINKQVIKIVKAYKTELIFVEEDDGQGGYLNNRIKKVNELLDKIPNSFSPDQYHNIDNPEAHYNTVSEILEQMPQHPDYVFVPTSTCGTIMGIAMALKKHNASTKIIAVDAVGSILFGDKPQQRRIPGMGSSKKSYFLDIDMIHKVIHVSEKEIIDACYETLNEESILIGGSSGAVVAAIKKMSLEIEPGSSVVGIFADNGERYLDTIYNEEWINSLLYDLEKVTH